MLSPDTLNLLALDRALRLSGNKLAMLSHFAAEHYPRPTSRTFAGLKVMIENDQGTERSGIDADGHPWRTYMHFPYGYIAKATGADGEGLDVYLGPDEHCKDVYVVHQNDPVSGAYDEDKVMLGWDSPNAAKNAYLKQYDRPGFFRSLTVIPLPAFKKMLTRSEPGAVRWKRKHKRGHHAAAFFSADADAEWDAEACFHTPFCPKCYGRDLERHSRRPLYRCRHCHHQWSSADPHGAEREMFAADHFHSQSGLFGDKGGSSQGRLFDKDEGGHWVTMGSHEGQDGKKHGGSPVFIKGGEVEKGPKPLAGKKVAALKAKPATPPQQVKQSAPQLAAAPKPTSEARPASSPEPTPEFPADEELGQLSDEELERRIAAAHVEKEQAEGGKLDKAFPAEGAADPALEEKVEAQAAHDIDENHKKAVEKVHQRHAQPAEQTPAPEPQKTEPPTPAAPPTPGTAVEEGWRYPWSDAQEQEWRDLNERGALKRNGAQQARFGELDDARDYHNQEKRHRAAADRHRAMVADGVKEVRGAEAYRTDAIDGKRYWFHKKTSWNKHYYSFDGGNEWATSRREAFDQAKARGKLKEVGTAAAPAPEAAEAPKALDNADVDTTRQLGLYAKDASGNAAEVGERPGQASLFNPSKYKNAAPTPQPQSEVVGSRNASDPKHTASMFACAATLQANASGLRRLISLFRRFI